MADVWLPSLKTDNPQAGFELAVKLSRMGVKLTQPSDQVRAHLRALAVARVASRPGRPLSELPLTGATQAAPAHGVT